MGTKFYKNLLFSVLFACVFPLTGLADTETTHFLGFAVDGSKEQMIENIKSKGFIYNKEDDFFTGIYYGQPSYIFVKTKNNVVSRIIVYDIAQRNATEIKERFNTLYGRYLRNDRYISLQEEDARIPAKEDVGYEMRIHNKLYKAVFGQMRTNSSDSITVQTRATRPSEMPPIDSEKLRVDIRERRRRLHAKAMSFANGVEPSKHLSQVWFTISEKFGMYGIIFFYDNIKNLLKED